MTKLSEALANYYRREGRKIIFKNSLTLNQLALKMWEELNFSQVEPSVLSRVISGSRLFTQSQLEVFCGILDISESERDYLYTCLREDICQRQGITRTVRLSISNELDVVAYLLTLVMLLLSVLCKDK